MLKNLLKPLKSMSSIIKGKKIKIEKKASKIKLFLINSFNEISISWHDFRCYTKLILVKIFKQDFDFLSKFQY